MAQTLILLRKSILAFRRARAALTITFLVPIVLIYLFGHVFGLYRKDTGPSGIPLAVVNESPDPAARDLLKALKAEQGLEIIDTARNADGTSRPLTEADVRAGLQNNAYRFALILPRDLLSDERIGLRLQFLTNPRNEIEAQTVNGLVQKTLFSNVPTLLGKSLQQRARAVLGNERFTAFNHQLAHDVAATWGGDPAAIEERISAGDFFGTGSTAGATSTGSASSTAADTDNVLSRIVRIETEQVAGREVKNPMAARIVGGYAIMFLLFAVSGSASAMFEEKSTGVFQRLLSSPVRPAHIVWARFFFGVLLGLVQILALFLAGRLFFGLDIFGHALPLLAVATAAAAACSAFGLFIAAVSPSSAAASGLATFLVISMSAVGGAWFPVSFMPHYIQAVSKLTVVYWSVEGLTDVLWAGHSLVQVLPKIGILLGMAAAVMLVSTWRFNRNRFFE